MSDNAYVYALLVDDEVRYIGKGTGRRMRDHLNLINRVVDGKDSSPKVQVMHRRAASAIKSGSTVRAMKMVVDLADQEAYFVERDIIGGYPDGHLWNIHEGGQGCSSDDAVARWQDPEYRARQESARHSPETIRRKSEASSISQNDPVVRERVKAAQRAAFARPESKARLVARNKKMWESDEYRSRVVAGRKAQWTPEARARQSEKHKAKWTDEHRATRAAAFKALFQDPEYKARWMASRAASRARKKAVS